MKKIVFFLFLLIIFSHVSASSLGEYTILTNKCSTIKDNKINISVKVVALNNGILSQDISEYTLGKLDNNDHVEIINVKGDNIKSIKLDTQKDSYNQSYLKIKLSKDIKLTELKEFLKFNLVIEFDKDIPNTIDILDNKVIISNEKICHKLNENSIQENKNLQDVTIIKEEHKEKENNSYSSYIIIILIICIIILLIKKKRQ